jgi:serine/threonine-protein kinase RsbW
MDTSQTRVFPGQFDSLATIGEFVVKAAKAAGLDERAIYEVQMAVDEACSNIVEHAYGGKGHGPIECTCHIDQDGLTVILRDYGQPFDPTCASAPVLDCDLQDRQAGGLGLYFMRQMMDQVRFEFTSESGNVLTLVKCREPTSCE